MRSRILMQSRTLTKSSILARVRVAAMLFLGIFLTLGLVAINWATTGSIRGRLAMLWSVTVAAIATCFMRSAHALGANPGTRTQNPGRISMQGKFWKSSRMAAMVSLLLLSASSAWAQYPWQVGDVVVCYGGGKCECLRIV